jgi:hypothetical protein
MSITNNMIVLFLIAGLYALTWFLPIFSEGTTTGYEGAVFAIETLKDGFAHVTGHPGARADTMSEALLEIIAGLCNILFIGAVALAYKKPAWSYIISPLVVVSMLVWFSFEDLGIGYYLWLLSGVLLFLYCLHSVCCSRELSLSGVLAGKWALPMYLPVLFTGALYITHFVHEGA